MSNIEFLFQILINKPWVKRIGIITVILLGWFVISFFMARSLIVQGTSYSDKGDYDTAIIYFDIATWINPFYPYKAYAYYNRGLAYFKQGTNDLALADFKKTIELDPKFSSAYVGQCAIHLIQREYDAVITECTE